MERPRDAVSHPVVPRIGQRVHSARMRNPRGGHLVTPSEGLAHRVLTHSNGTSLIFFPVQSGSWWEAIRPAPKEHLHATDWPDGWLDLICPPLCGLIWNRTPNSWIPGQAKTRSEVEEDGSLAIQRWCRNFFPAPRAHLVDPCTLQCFSSVQ